jgi:hypothetical protein
MQKKLAELCERQLQSILNETHNAFDRIVDSATVSFKLSNALKNEAPATADQDQPAVRTGVENISQEMQKLLVSLQFHDELSQRVEHVIALCKLLTESVARSGASEETDPVLLERVADLFSVSAEFDALQQVFPEYRHKDAGVAIELF